MVEFQKNGHFKIADDLALAARITQKLSDCYPGHLWGVGFDEDGGVVNIVCETVQHPLMTNAQYAYTLHISRFATDPDLKCVMRAGGEILERARIDRHRFTGDIPKSVEGVLPKHQPILDKNGQVLTW